MQTRQTKAWCLARRIDVVVVLFLGIARDDHNSVTNLKAIGAFAQHCYLAGGVSTQNVRGINVEVHEFDYTGVNQVVYDVNGVVIRSWPAIHAIDGPVSFSLEWNGLKFVFGGAGLPLQG